MFAVVTHRLLAPSQVPFPWCVLTTSSTYMLSSACCVCRCTRCCLDWAASPRCSPAASAAAQAACCHLLPNNPSSIILFTCFSYGAGASAAAWTGQPPPAADQLHQLQPRPLTFSCVLVALHRNIHAYPAVHHLQVHAQLLGMCSLPWLLTSCVRVPVHWTAYLSRLPLSAC
jgi:hypothetical protein